MCALFILSNFIFSYRICMPVIKTSVYPTIHIFRYQNLGPKYLLKE